MKALTFLLLTAFTTLFLIIANGTPGRTAPLASKRGVDVVILLDQSGSMSGRNQGSVHHPEPNDPHGFRVDAVRNFMSRLATASAQASAMGNPQSHRVAVVEFGSSASVILDWAIIDASSSGAGNSLSRIQSIVNEKNLEFTHFIDAFEKAEGLYTEIQYGRDAGQERKLAVYLITDGQPYSKSLSESDGKSYLRNGAFDHKRYWRDLEAKINAIFSEAQANQTRVSLYVLALNDADPYWVRTEPYWRPLSKKAAKIDSNDELIQHLDILMNDLLEGLIDVEIQAIKDEYDCPCYLHKVRFRVYQRNPGASIQVFSPDGTSMNMAQALVERSNTYAVYDFVQPESGLWRIQGTKDTDVYVEPFYDNVNLTNPGIGGQVPNMPFPIQWEVVSSINGRKFAPDPKCNFQVESILSGPNNNTYNLNMVFENNGIFRSQQNFDPPAIGKYLLALKGYSPTVQSGRSVVFQGAPQPIFVNDTNPLVLKFEEPKQVELRFGKGLAEIKTRVINYRKSSAKIKLSEISGQPNKLVSVKVRNQKGKVLINQAYLKPDAGAGPDILRTSLLIKDSFHPLSVVKRDGNVTFEFEVHDQYLDNRYFFYKMQGFKGIK